MYRIAGLLGLVRKVYRRTIQRRVPFLAAAVAFYGFVSIIPLFLLALSIGSWLGLPLLETALSFSETVLSPGAQAVLRTSLEDQSGRGSATVVGVLFLAWSGIRVFRGLDTAFSQVYGAPLHEPLGDQLVDAGLALVTVPVAFAVSAAFGVALPLVVPDPLVGLVGRLALVLTLGILFVPMYVRFPDVPVSVAEAVPGALFAAVGWSALALGFSVYAGAIGRFQLYGVLGAGLLLVTWMYLGGIIIMVGAVLNAVSSGRIDDEAERTESVDGDRAEPVPDLGAVAHEVRDLRSELDEKTVSRSALEDDLKAYVRWRMRRGKARGWGPYLVLLYGTAMTLGAFYWLDGGWSILAMIVVWLSTLGLYVLMVLFGAAISTAGVPGRIFEVVRNRRS